MEFLQQIQEAWKSYWEPIILNVWSGLPAWLQTALSELVWIALGFLVAWYLVFRRGRKEAKQFKKGHIPGETIGSTLIFDEGTNGQVYLKPRVDIEPRPIERSFPSIVKQQALADAISRTDDTPEGSFLIMSDRDMHHEVMENARAIMSTLGADGHNARAEGNPFKEEIYYVMLTFSKEGKHRKVRIDMVHESQIEKLADPMYVSQLTGRAEEGSHADLAAICHIMAKKRVAAWNDPSLTDEADIYSLRTSISHRIAAPEVADNSW